MSASAELVFYYGPMGAGKSTLALQTHFNQRQQGRSGVLLTKDDRSNRPLVTSRIGLAAEAIAVDDHTDVYALITGRGIPDFLVCDEAQFLTIAQVDQLAGLVDDHAVSVFAYGLLTDFRSVLFPGSARLVEIADEIHRMQAVVLCWCGRDAFLNARIVNGRMVHAGELIAIGDTGHGPVHYRPLCRRHFTQGRIDAGGEPGPVDTNSQNPFSTG